MAQMTAWRDFEVLALTDLDNTPSQAVATRLGMRDEGTTGRWFGLTTRQYRTGWLPGDGFWPVPAMTVPDAGRPG